MSEDRPLRIGILGAAAIAPAALLQPARAVGGVTVAAVAARDPARARVFAARHGIPRVHEGYAELLEDPEIDAVYVPLPNALHAEWSIRALRAGKPVLCEKPLASNAAEAERMAGAAEETGLPLVEAFHWSFHPLAARSREILRSGEIGEVRHLEMDFCVPLLKPGDIRFRYDLAGGSAMDLGCYAIHWIRFHAEAEPQVVSARARLSSPGLDRWIEAELRFPDGRTGRMVCSLAAFTMPRIRGRVVGSRGELRVTNPVAPHLFHRLRVRSRDGTRRERVPGRATYVHQLEAFAARVRGGPPLHCEAREGVANMAVIDAVYDAAGLPRRGVPAPPPQAPAVPRPEPGPRRPDA
jgi:predicted dehydrogenase